MGIKKELDRLERKFDRLMVSYVRLYEQVACGVVGHAFTVTDRFSDGPKTLTLCQFRCNKCRLEYTRLAKDLTPREQKLVEAVYGEIGG